MNGDRTVHASGSGWEVVRYNRSGKWYAEPVDPKVLDLPFGLPTSLRLICQPNRAGRIAFSKVTHAANFAWFGCLQHDHGRSGGSAFDRLMRESMQS